MKNYVGIDLGTTNSAICSYDGDQTRIWKSPEQNDVTPSAIFIDRRGGKFVGKRAYDSAPHSPKNAAVLFKRQMGTSTPVQLSAAKTTMTPEECSSEILRTLFGYLPEELRDEEDVGTVITVPAAFNQMQKNATMQAAELAGIGRVALMQEPVAAVMSVMKGRNTDGVFVIYDLGGGTLDIALADSMRGRINILAHGGITWCGGRDFDRLLVDNVIKPWLHDNFDLPDDLFSQPDYEKLLRLGAWAAERAKIELSSREETVICLSETEVRVEDQAGNEVYLDIPINRSIADSLMEEKVEESIGAARKTIENAGMSPNDIDRVVFIGGPTHYKPLRDKVSFELGIKPSTEINPMTAVAEGAALFAESVEWNSVDRGRKSSRGKLTSKSELKPVFNYTARTPDTRAKIVVQTSEEIPDGTEFQIDSSDTGWTSGRISLKDGASVDLNLVKSGKNTFRIFLFDETNSALEIAEDMIIITRTAATVDAIPASHSVGIEILEKFRGASSVQWLVRSGDQLPKKGSQTFKAAESLKAGGSGSLNFKLLEGESDDPSDNLFIGYFKITGKDFDEGVIPAGAELHCYYEMLDSGHIKLSVSTPAIGVELSSRNFYSRQDGQIDFSKESARVIEEGERTRVRLEEMNEKIDDLKIDEARIKLEASSLLDPDEPDAERTQQAMEGVNDARRILADVRKENRDEIRQMDLDSVKYFFDEEIREYARPSEERTFDNLVRTAQRSIDNNNNDFDSLLSELKGNNFVILFRQDWFIIKKFEWMSSSPHHFSDPARFQALVSEGLAAREKNNIPQLREVIGQLYQIQIDSGSDAYTLDVNIIRG